MKIDILDTAMNSNGMSYFDLTERIETLEKAGAQIKDIKHISSYPDGRNFTTAILYEEPTIIQQQSFYTRGGGKEINQFLDDYYDRYTGMYLKSKNFLRELKKINQV